MYKKEQYNQWRLLAVNASIYHQQHSITGEAEFPDSMMEVRQTYLLVYLPVPRNAPCREASAQDDKTWPTTS